MKALNITLFDLQESIDKRRELLKTYAHVHHIKCEQGHYHIHATNEPSKKDSTFTVGH